MVAAISSSRVSERLKFDEIRDVVLSKSLHKREVGDSSGSALSVDQRGRSETEGQNQHGGTKSKNRGKSLNKDLLELWRKRALSDELYKAKEETESEIWR